ncbi:RNA-binding domain-containing protein [Methanotorris igneus]|uniref:UPF0201 protein Metig_0045 n=1 Tax=Methanotorris igneus (strain DSM 5666 / JCM 11834 / Kol 5) TaxID=880724 RepID=F6BEE5_METIK|nr:RNA-binding domain-containing protein [Methanotorris igneus]AEF95606.1 protein of unknown function DUF54 [Methanotorris igneus Kol 5]
MIVKIKAKVKPTEDKGKVKRAILKIFPKAELEFNEEYNYWEGETKNVDRFKELLRSQAILDAARVVLEKGIVGDYTKFFINKQAAYVGSLNFDRDVHGGIEVKIIAEENEDLMKIIKDIAPRTKNGVIINEDEEMEENEEETKEEANN